jgi:lipopolysaccharide/colanic/teichoic acid biosynthesis glycosyltransferase
MLVVFAALLQPLITWIAKAQEPGPNRGVQEEPVSPEKKRTENAGRAISQRWCRTQTKETLRARNQRQGPTFKIADDPRITRVGRGLRRYSLDELPQLWNVWKGDMSLVGPRPHPVDDYARYRLEHLRRLDMTPGITGL